MTVTVTALGATDTSVTSNAGLSSGAKAGIGVGVAIGAIILIALLWGMFVLNRKRKQKPNSGNIHELSTTTEQPSDKPPLGIVEADSSVHYIEADSQEARHEMSADSQGVKYEMQA